MSEFDRRTREYILELITTLKTTRNRIASAEAGRDRWAERERLARQKGREELASEAARRKIEEEERLARLRQQERELAAEAEEARGEWTRAGIREQMNVDAERLLASLERVAGAPDSAAEELQSLEVDSELSRLKEQLESEEQNAGTSSDEHSPEEEESP